jgi:hypothetical protein
MLNQTFNLSIPTCDICEEDKWILYSPQISGVLKVRTLYITETGHIAATSAKLMGPLVKNVRVRAQCHVYRNIL